MAKRRDEMLKRAEMVEAQGKEILRTCKLVKEFSVTLAGEVEVEKAMNLGAHIASNLVCSCRIGHRPEPFIKKYSVRGWDWQKLRLKGDAVSVKDELDGIQKAVVEFFKEIRAALSEDMHYSPLEREPEPEPEPQVIEPPKRRPGRPRKAVKAVEQKDQPLPGPTGEPLSNNGEDENNG